MVGISAYNSKIIRRLLLYFHWKRSRLFCILNLLPFVSLIKPGKKVFSSTGAVFFCYHGWSILVLRKRFSLASPRRLTQARKEQLSKTSVRPVTTPVEALLLSTCLSTSSATLPISFWLFLARPFIWGKFLSANGSFKSLGGDKKKPSGFLYL